MNESKQEREERKRLYVMYVLRKGKDMVDQAELTKQAEEQFEEANPL